MRYALIDNSTLTAVQRVLGEIPIKNKFTIDGDILALESYIESILFYDKLVYLDDYKEQYRTSRKAFFNNMLDVSLAPTSYDQFVAESKSITESIVPRVEAGQFTDNDFKPFFDQLKMSTTFTWDISSSVYFLTVKMLQGVGGLDIGKYSKLSTMIYNELSDKGSSTPNVKNDFILYDSKGNRIDTGYHVLNKENISCETDISNGTELFFASLNWLAFRTTFYTLVANELGVDLVLHPIRNAFHVNLLSKMAHGSGDFFSSLIAEMNGNVNETINKIVSPTNPFILKQNLPLFCTWLAARTGDPREFIGYAYEMRNSKPFIQARKQLIELEDMLANSDRGNAVTEANKLILSIQMDMDKMCAEYGVKTAQGIPLSTMINVWNLTTLVTQLPKIPAFSGSIKAPKYIRDMIPTRGFKSVYRNLINDLVKIERLGKYHDIITSNVKVSRGAGYYETKQEDSKFARFKSWWKLPM